MVFLDKNSEKLTINRHFPEDCEKIEIVNNFSRDKLVFEHLENISDSQYYYEFDSIDLSTLADGEYIISLYDENDNLIESMLGVCGDYKRKIPAYSKENNNRKVYER